MNITRAHFRQYVFPLATGCLLALTGCGGSDGSVVTGNNSGGSTGGNSNGNGGSSGNGGGSSTTSSASLRWTAPTTNDDGTPLTDLAGYHIYVSTRADLLNDPPIEVDSSKTNQVVDKLTVGITYYFAITAVNGTGTESALSNTVSKTIS